MSGDTPDAAQPACTSGKPRVWLELRPISRDTTEMSRPMCRAMARSDQPAFKPVESSAEHPPSMFAAQPSAAAPSPDPACRCCLDAMSRLDRGRGGVNQTLMVSASRAMLESGSTASASHSSRARTRATALLLPPM